HQALAFEDLDERLELQIPPRRRDRLAGLLAPLVLLPRLLVGLRAREGVADHVLDAEPRARVARRAAALSPAGAAARALGVLAERELDAGQRTLEREILGARFSPAQLDHVVLAADRVRAPVQHVRRRQAAGQIAVDVDIARVEDVFDAGHRA